MRTSRILYRRYNVQETTGFVYGAMNDFDQSGIGRVKNASSSATWDAVAGTASATPFDELLVGDQIVAQGPMGNFERTITAKASGIQLTASAVADLSVQGANGFAYRFRTYKKAPAKDSAPDYRGWVPLGPGKHSILILPTIAATSIDYSVEIGNPDNTELVVVTTATVLAAASGVGIKVDLDGKIGAWVRVGLKMTGSGANPINVELVTEKLPRQ